MTSIPSKPSGSGNNQAVASAVAWYYQAVAGGKSKQPSKGKGQGRGPGLCQGNNDIEADETSDHCHGLSSTNFNRASQVVSDDTPSKSENVDTAAGRDAYVKKMLHNKIFEDKKAFKKHVALKFDKPDDKNTVSRIMLAYWKKTNQGSRRNIKGRENQTGTKTNNKDTSAAEEFEHNPAHDDHDGPSSTTMTTMTDTNHCHGYSSSSSVEEQCSHLGVLTIRWLAMVEMLRHENGRLQAVVSQYERDQHRLQQGCINVNPCSFFYGRGASMVAWQQQQRQRQPNKNKSS